MVGIIEEEKTERELLARDMFEERIIHFQGKASGEPTITEIEQYQLLALLLSNGTHCYYLSLLYYLTLLLSVTIITILHYYYLMAITILLSPYYIIAI